MAAGRLSLSLAVAAPVLIVAAGDALENRWSLAVRLWLLFWGLNRLCVHYDERARSTGMSAVLAEDARAPVVYLRAFENEEEPFTALSAADCQRLGVPIVSVQGVYHPATLEAYFAREIRERVGPFVALGDPDDYVPSVGAAREYVDDHGWRQVFEDLARRSQFMLMRPEASDNLLAEVRWLDAEALLGKLCVVTSAARERRFFPRPWGRGWERRRWSGFAAALHSIGLDLGPYPGRGAVVSFDPGGTPVRVAAGAQSPAQYVEAIQRWRASGVESDAGAPVSRGDRVTGRPPGSPAAERPR